MKNYELVETIATSFKDFIRFKTFYNAQQCTIWIATIKYRIICQYIFAIYQFCFQLIFYL